MRTDGPRWLRQENGAVVGMSEVRLLPSSSELSTVTPSSSWVSSNGKSAKSIKSPRARAGGSPAGFFSHSKEAEKANGLIDNMATEAAATHSFLSVPRGA